MKRALLLGITAFLMFVLLAPGLAGADEWQTVTLGPLSFQLPGDWQLLEEELGFSELEMAWYVGEFLAPEHYLILAIGEDLVTLMDMFVLQDDSAEVMSDEVVSFLGQEARKVNAFNQAADEYGMFFVIEDLTGDGEDLFLMVGGPHGSYEDSLPLTEEIIASFTMAD